MFPTRDEEILDESSYGMCERVKKNQCAKNHVQGLAVHVCSVIPSIYTRSEHAFTNAVKNSHSQL